MRDVFAQILDFAKQDPNVKIVMLNGSRANPNAPKDFLQDYDIRMYVSSLEGALCYKHDWGWMSQFGELVIVQQNNFKDGAFIFLMQFENTTRIDLSFQRIEELDRELTEDSLSKLLMDKDGIIHTPPVPNETSYYIKKPEESRWDEVLNELWWLQPYVAKELFRDELPLVKELYDIYLMGSLRTLLEWHIGYEHNWEVNAGHGGKWFKRLLPTDIYEEFISLYASANATEQWDKLLRMGAFIQKLGIPLAQKLGYAYPMAYDESVTNYLKIFLKMPCNFSFPVVQYCLL